MAVGRTQVLIDLCPETSVPCHKDFIRHSQHGHWFPSEQVREAPPQIETTAFLHPDLITFAIFYSLGVNQ